VPVQVRETIPGTPTPTRLEAVASINLPQSESRVPVRPDESWTWRILQKFRVTQIFLEDARKAASDTGK
jgi:hypothetical protein